jgi:hypothetical protein
MRVAGCCEEVIVRNLNSVQETTHSFLTFLPANASLFRTNLRSARTSADGQPATRRALWKKWDRHVTGIDDEQWTGLHGECYDGS